MSHFTPADRDYVKTSLQKIKDLAYEAGRCIGQGYTAVAEKYAKACDEEQARLVAFIDGTTLEKGKGK